MTLKCIFNVENRNKYQIHAVCNAALQQIYSCLIINRRIYIINLRTCSQSFYLYMNILDIWVVGDV